MKPLTQLVDALAADYNPDYWSDHVKIETGRMIDALGERDWRQLERIWPTQSAGWRIRFSDASLLSEKPRVLALLGKMLGSPEASVGAAIAAALLEKNYVWDPSVNLRADLQRHLATATRPEAAVINRLLAQLPA